MDIVVSHLNTDFDALASQIAVAKIHPGTVRVSQGSESPAVRDFLALHKEYFELTPLDQIDIQAVKRLFLVDVRRRSRLKKMAPLLERKAPLEIVVYDHHAASNDDIPGSSAHVAPVGATTTLLVEQLRAENVLISPVEATAFALGIYHDTGSLTYPSTTQRDADAATFLIGRGASLPTLRYFLHSPLQGQQRRVMIELLGQSEVVTIGGVQIGLAVVPLKKSIIGLSDVINDVLTLQGQEALFALFPRGKNVSIIGRSQVPWVDAGNILQALGGGGHQGAGSVVLRNTNAEAAREQLLEQLHSSPPSPSLVRHLMSTPVHTVGHDPRLDRVLEDLESLKISGAPVIREDRIVGIISKRDIRAAVRDGRQHLPVASCMSQNIKCIDPDTPLIRALEQMLQADIGRLPVIERGNLIGIITRSDALRILYPSGNYPKEYKKKS